MPEVTEVVTYGEGVKTRAILTYSVDETETEATITARTQFQAKTFGHSGYRVNIKLGGTTVVTKHNYIPDYYSNWTNVAGLDTGEHASTYAKKHTAQSVVLKSEYYGEAMGAPTYYNAGDTSGDYSVTISIPAKASYTVSYNANEGSGAPPSQTKWCGENLILSSTKPTRTNYKFLGWATSSSATTATYQAGGTYTANAGATLYAVWQINGYTVSYNKGANGTGTNTSDTKIHDTPLTLKGAIFTRTNYTQTGWATSDGGAQAYTLGARYTANAAITLYPVWTQNTWTVSYDLQGGTGSFANQTKQYNVPLTLRSGSPSKADASAGSYIVTFNCQGGDISGSETVKKTSRRTASYPFSEWNTDKSGAGTSYSPGDQYTKNKDVTLYAIYDEMIATESIRLAANPSKIGYTFNGWFPSASGGTRIGWGGTEYIPTATTTLYAQWLPQTFPVKYYAPGATNIPAEQEKVYDVDLTLRSGRPAKTDYIFKGWGIYQGTTTVSYLPGAKYTGNTALNLWAVFELDYSSPSITNVKVVRCNSSGTAEDDGRYAKVSCSWSTFSTNFNATEIKVEYKRTVASTWTTGYTDSNPNAHSGTLSAVIGGSLGTEFTYDVRITVSDGNGSESYTTFLSSAFYTIDINAAQTAVAFGMSAIDTASQIPANGRMDVAMDAHFNAGVEVKNEDIYNALFYKAGDTFSAMMGMTGYCGAGSTEIVFRVRMPKSIKNVTATLTAFSGRIRHVSGGASAWVDGNTGDWMTITGVTVTCTKVAASNELIFTITKANSETFKRSASSTTAVLQNTPVYGTITPTITFT